MVLQLTVLVLYTNLATVTELMEETKEVVELEMLAVYLEIKTEVVKKIKVECSSDVDRTKIGLFDFWVKNDLNASWSKLTAALQCLDKRVLAKRISDKMSGEWITHLYDLLLFFALTYLL